MVGRSPAGAIAILPSLASLAYSRPMDDQADDSALMERYRAGDLAAFERLYRRHKDPLYRYLLRLLGRREAAEDVFQEAWGKLIQARASYRPTAKFRTYLFHVAHNCCIDFVRRNRRHQRDAAADPDLEWSRQPGPEVLAEHALMRRRLDHALSELPQEQREAWLLSEEGGLGPEQIGEVTGVNRETAKSRVRYAAAKLKSRLEPPAADDVAATLGATQSRAPVDKVGTS